MKRGPVPDKPRDRPTVPEVAAALRFYYKLPHRGNGGAVHIILEDGNTRQAHADWCLANARHWGMNAEWGGRGAFVEWDVLVARLIAALTGTQRRKLSCLSFYPWLP